MKYSSADVAFLIIGGYDVRADTTEFSFSATAETRDSTVLGDDWREFTAVGLKTGEITQNGFFDDEENHIHDSLKDSLGLSGVVMFAPEGGELGDKVIGMAGAIRSGYERRTAIGELTGASGQYMVNGAVEQNGKILHPLGAETADDDTEATDLDNAASSGDGGSGYLGVTALALDTATGLVVKVRHSADSAVFADLITFTSAADITAERLTVAGTVNRYLATSWAWTGGAGGASSATFVVAFHRN